jgi:hypothetical protein
MADTGVPTINTKWRLDVNTGTTASPVWVQVRGMSNFNPAVANTVNDSTDYDSVGWGSDNVTLRKFQPSGTVMRKLYAGAEDPGQKAIRQAADSLTELEVRYYERVAGGAAYQGSVMPQWEDQAGDPAGNSTANFTLLGQGARTAIENPNDTATGVPVIYSASPNNGSTAGGELVTITGTGFTTVTGATGVKFGSTNATNYTVVSDSKIVATAPANTAGAKDIVVTNGVGASTTGTGAYTYA